MKKYIVSRLWIIVFLPGLLLFYGCKKKVDEVKPVEPVVEELKIVADSIGKVGMETVSFWGKVTAAASSTTERGVCWGLAPNPTVNKAAATWYRTSGEFGVDLQRLTPGTSYYIRGYATNSRGTVYTPDLQFKTVDKPAADIRIFTDTMSAAGVSTAFVAGSAQITNGTLAETGICISESLNPTITDRKVTTPGKNDLNFFLRIDGLKEATRYYIRAYGTDDKGSTYYGNTVTLFTITKGKITWRLNWEDPNADAATKEAYARIKIAFDRAVELLNNFTSIEKSLTVNYSPGTPTADGNISGWINMGANAAYQRAGTAIHEINHTVGVGTSWFWGQLIQNGVCTGAYTNKMLQFMTRSSSALVHGDGQHFWPYGINGSWEDTGAEMDYIITCLIIQGMKRDGLPSY